MGPREILNGYYNLLKEIQSFVKLMYDHINHIFDGGIVTPILRNLAFLGCTRQLTY